MEELKTQIVLTDSIDPAYNLSFEDWLLENVDKKAVIMFLWQNKNAVVIGRNQNPWKECRLDLMKNEDVTLIRRSSGGGTVYHDLGNLNFTFIASKDIYDVSRQTDIIVKALDNLGIKTEINERKDLLAEGNKFSGTAYVHKNKKSLHHGTLLVNSNLELLERYLSKPKLKIQSKGVDSIRSKVINLNEINKDLTIDILKNELVKAFKEEYNSDTMINYYDKESIKEVVGSGKYKEWEWNFAESPSFSIAFENAFSWGNLQLEFKINNGIIIECNFKSESLENNELDKLMRALVDKPFKTISIVNQIENMSIDSLIIKEINEYVISII